MPADMRRAEPKSTGTNETQDVITELGGKEEQRPQSGTSHCAIMSIQSFQLMIELFPKAMG